MKITEKLLGFIGLYTEQTTAPTGTDFAVIKLSSGDEVKIQLNNLIKGKRTLILTAAGSTPSTTNGCADPAKVEFATNGIDVIVIDFDALSDESAQWAIPMPAGYDGGTIDAKFIWTQSGDTNTSHQVVWGIKALALDNGNAIDQAFGTEVTIASLNAGENLQIVSALLGGLTPSNSPAGGKTLVFKVSRKATDANDDLTVDARLLAVRLTYGINKWSDS